LPLNIFPATQPHSSNNKPARYFRLTQTQYILHHLYCIKFARFYTKSRILNINFIFLSAFAVYRFHRTSHCTNHTADTFIGYSIMCKTCAFSRRTSLIFNMSTIHSSIKYFKIDKTGLGAVLPILHKEPI